MFEDANASERRMLALGYNPCPHCGSNPDEENVVSYVGLSRMSGCCVESVACISGVTRDKIVEFPKD